MTTKLFHLFLFLAAALWFTPGGVMAQDDSQGFDSEYRIRVRPNYKIKVGEDWGWVNVGDVAEFRRGVWYVNVRDIWRATHQRGERWDRDRENDDAPDWRR